MASSIFRYREHHVGKSATMDFDASHVATAPGSCATSFNPSCAQKMYGIPTRRATQRSNRLGIVGLASQWINDTILISRITSVNELSSYLDQRRREQPERARRRSCKLPCNVRPLVLFIHSIPANVQQDLDSQYTIGLASGVPVEFLTVGEAAGNPFDEPFTKLTDRLLNTTHLPSVLSISYTLPEVFTDFATANHICNGFAQLGAPGISIFVGSGDWGITGQEDPNQCRTFNAMAPSSCPYKPMSSRTRRLSQPHTTGCTTGPGAQDMQINGTSAATPVLASIAALLNDELVAAGKSPIGFMNPLIYANKEAFNDITSGSNPGCNTNGFSAIQG
ncbi:hypothetical protein EVG20_g9602 [Dentipellis fragilis]|uniref:Peptidase S53 domain-containing protein n=1 Tax=Dentipellis fragilis TaxID=205917 RepID=A0A4Y9XZY7_9AGAM|nr:hypothetical protein EVG20_g9602 [Dentipellis fragilis]